MKTLIGIIGISALLCCTGFSYGEEAAKQIFSGQMTEPATNLTVADLPDNIKAGLLLMREEEKLAHDLYAAFAEMYELPIFGNIAASEANHTAAVLRLLQQYGLEDPALTGKGEFRNKKLQQAYNQLLDSGSESLVAALKNGAYVEELDILDLEEQLKQVEDDSIRRVYSNLLRASYNHLRAFNRVLDRNGVDYNPQLLSVKSFDEIVSADNECGHHGRKGRHGKSCKK
ncbi:DUF2202 domain-containing protein [Mangrovibacterium marinum]|uniref:DUF2202 domain-containing protein n=1 Tax=Mangrovibacterium marinum TaxID=1639118 RepID=A0A2T5BXN1_9BACT|nr:DUF2202 domain-containing protein [Mangrovibacterium marinum]PTN05602.1 hypothetical protein C8N47_12621 [Mangrovibacterium marinum]